MVNIYDTIMVILIKYLLDQIHNLTLILKVYDYEITTQNFFILSHIFCRLNLNYIASSNIIQKKIRGKSKANQSQSETHFCYVFL